MNRPGSILIPENNYSEPQSDYRGLDDRLSNLRESLCYKPLVLLPDTPITFSIKLNFWLLRNKLVREH